MQIKGLFGDLEGIGENAAENQSSSQQTTERTEFEAKTEGYENIIGPQEMLDSLEEIADSFETVNGTLVKTINSTPLKGSNSELDLQVDGLIEKKEGLWTCKVCGKRATRKEHAKSHVETHLMGVSYACHICSTTTSTRQNLRNHISRTHSELFSCNVCGMSGMNRGAYQTHKQNNHRSLSIQQEYAFS